MSRDFVTRDKQELIAKLLKTVKELANSSNSNYRKGGLLGLAAMAIGLGSSSKDYINDLIKPILSSLIDQDSRVRYYACEAALNAIKSCRHDSLQLFNEIFFALSKIVADPDMSVKGGAESLDRIMKDIVSENNSFNLVTFIPLLRERMYAINPAARQFIVSWIDLLHSVPDIDILSYLSEYIEGLFKILSDPKPEISSMCSDLLQELLNSTMNNPEKVDFSSLINILLIHSQAQEATTQYTALVWLKEFMNLADTSSLISYSAGLLAATLPRLAPSSTDDNENLNISHDHAICSTIREVAKAINYSLRQLVTMEQEQDRVEINSHATMSSNSAEVKEPTFQISSLIEVLICELSKGNNCPTSVKLACLDWLEHLISKVPDKIAPHIEKDILPILIKTLRNPSNEVVISDLKVLGLIFSNFSDTNHLSTSTYRSRNEEFRPDYFSQFMSTLLQLFFTESSFLEDRCSFIVKHLCLIMNAEDIFRSLSEILLDYQDFSFSYKMVQILNKILLTSSELNDLRCQLRGMKTDESCSLFCCLYRTWCHSPVATVALCLITRNYEHACDLLKTFADLEITLQFLTELDQLIQLIESPIFACK